ncbi:MAG: tetratricopeptide repeat protein [Planctomycetota bacterium]|jgi:tetratricopeptide (TPR) repeat protein
MHVSVRCRRTGRARALLIAGAIAALPGCPLGGGGGGSGQEKEIRHAVARLKSGDEEGRRAAVQTLMRMNGHELKVVPPLIEALDDADAIVQTTAAEALRSVLRKPNMPESRVAWEELWRREKPRIEKRNRLDPQDQIKLAKANVKNEEGYLEMKRGRFKKAEELFLEAVAADPTDPGYWNNLGKCNANQGRLPSAIGRYQRAIEEDPSFAPAHYNLGEAYLEISRLTSSNRTLAALGEAEAAVKLDRRKQDWASRWLKARVLHHMAVAELEAAKRIDLYRSAGEAIQEATKIISRATRISTEEAEVRKTAALIAYGRELYYAAYKEVVRVHQLGYEMDADFVTRLDEALRRVAHNAGVEPPKMPERSGKSEPKGQPPALRLPY